VSNGTQSNITGVGTLTSLSVSGNLNMPNGRANVNVLDFTGLNPRSEYSTVTAGIIDPNGPGQGIGGFRTGFWQMASYTDANLYITYGQGFDSSIAKMFYENFSISMTLGKVYATSGFVAGNPGSLNPPTANISGGNLLVGTLVSSGGNISAAGNINAGSATNNSVSAGGNIIAGGQLRGASISTGGNVTITGAGRLVAAGIENTNWGWTSVAISGGNYSISNTLGTAKRVYVFTGAGGTVIMPLTNLTTVVPEYFFINRCTGQLYIVDQYLDEIVQVPSLTSCTMTGRSTSTLAASTWQASVSSAILGLACGGQNWQDVTASRTFNTNYTNSTGRPIMVSVLSWFGVNQSMSLLVSGISVSQGGWSSFAYGYVSATVSAVVPPGQTYQVSSGGTSLALSWSELR
jgi:hypothetical protein